MGPKFIATEKATVLKALKFTCQLSWLPQQPSILGSSSKAGYVPSLGGAFLFGQACALKYPHVCHQRQRPNVPNILPQMRAGKATWYTRYPGISLGGVFQRTKDDILVGCVSRTVLIESGEPQGCH